MATAAVGAGLRPRVVLFGDSITQHGFAPGGWAAALQDEYARKVDVVLRGYSGYNSRWALYLLDHIFPPESVEHAPALVTIFFGANDAALPTGDSKRQHVPLSEYKANLRYIVEHIQRVSSSTKVILITPPPIDEESRRIYARQKYGHLASGIAERTNDVTGDYASTCQEVALEMGLPAVDLWTRIQEQENWWTTCLSDGLHLAPAGNQVLLIALLQTIAEQNWQPSLVQANLPFDFPEHGEIDSENPSRTFKGLAKGMQLEEGVEAGASELPRKEEAWGLCTVVTALTAFALKLQHWGTCNVLIGEATAASRNASDARSVNEPSSRANDLGCQLRADQSANVTEKFEISAAAVICQPPPRTLELPQTSSSMKKQARRTLNPPVGRPPIVVISGRLTRHAQQSIWQWGGGLGCCLLSHVEEGLNVVLVGVAVVRRVVLHGQHARHRA
eukprot:SM000069S20660  [mRNA]  locus=s69:5956:9394:+ [translate_table: standard]